MLIKKTPIATSASTRDCPLLPINLTFLININIKRFDSVVENKNGGISLAGERIENYFIRTGDGNCFSSWKVLVLALISRGKTASFKSDKVVIIPMNAVRGLVEIDHRRVAGCF